MLIQLGTDGNDLINGTADNDILVGLGGDDTINGEAGDDLLSGDDGNDIVNGGYGNDLLTGGEGQDTLTGGAGQDVFLFSDQPFSGSSPSPTDILTDYQIGTDKLAFSSFQFGIEELNFQKGNSNQLSGNNNLLVLLDPFPNAAAAAQAIANNNAITADAGFFVYFNTTLGFSRVVFSQDLSDGGQISVLGNLTNQTNPANQGLFSSQDFLLG
ncbi:MAG: hypothetical protein VKL59_23050 [Nostocaceae cyanobacterium]|nr:hypothetical protein [Nostocaceae cyanobacterium]